MFINDINIFSHYGDIIAIPFFLVLSMYFIRIKKKTILEYILLIFSISGFILDIIYTIIYFYV
jgi:hypothetical protein